MGLNLANIKKKITDVAQGVERQINPFDNGMTYKQKTPLANLSVAQQASNLGKNVIQYPTQFVNTARAGAGGVYGLGRIGAAAVTGNSQAYNNAINQTQMGLNKDLSSTGGFLRQGTFFKDANEARNISAPEFTKRVIGKGLEGATFGAGPEAKVGSTVLATIGKKALFHGAENAVQSAGQALADGGNIKDIAKSAAIGAAIGTPMGAIGKPKTTSVSLTRSERPRVNPKLPETDDLNKRINAQVKETKDSLKPSVIQRVTNKVGELYDPLHEAVKIDQADAKSRGIKYRDLPAEQRLDFALDKTRYSARQARQLLDDNGVTDVIKRYPGKKENEFVNYLNARFAMEVGAKRGIDLIPGETPSTLGKYVKDFEARNPNAVNDAAVIKAHSDSLIDRGVKSGALSKEDGDFVKSYYQNYVPISRVIPEDLARADVQGHALGSIGRQRILQNIEDAPTRTVPLDNTFDALLKRTGTAVKQSNLADAQALYADKVSRGVAPGRLLVGAGNKEARADIREQERTLTAGVKQLNKQLTTNKKAARKLQSQIDKLNRLGLDEYLKRSPEELDKPILSGRRDFLRDRVELKSARSIQRDIPREANITGKQEGLAGGEFKDKENIGRIISTGAAEMVTDQFTRSLKSNETRKLVKDLINAEPAKLAAIRKKIANREPKLANQIDKVMEVQKNIANAKEAKGILKQQTSQLRDESTVGKQVVSGLNKGSKYQIETTPEIARMLQGLDEAKKTALEKGFGVPMKIFQTAWTGAINPVFSAISFAFYDLPMSAINSTQGLKVFAPKAVGEMFRSFNANSDFQKALGRAGAQITGGSQLPVNARLTAESIAAERNLATRFKFNATHPEEALRNLDVLGGKLSNATRTRVARAHYDDAIRQGANFEQAIAEAAQAYNNVLPNYGRVSPLVKNLNAVLPYAGASVAGTRSLLRAIKDDPAATVAKATSLIVAPAVGSVAYSLSNPQGQEFYQDMIDSKRQYNLDNNFIIVLPGAHKDEKTGAWNGVVKIPVPPEMRAVNSAAWRGTYDFMNNGQHQTSPQQTAGAVFDFMTGGLRTGGNPLIDTYRIALNQDSRGGGQITNENMLNLDKKDQVTESTTDAAKNLAKLTGYKLSPAQFDKVLQQFGFPGQLVQNREGSVVKTALKSVESRFVGAYGQSQGSQYFNSVDQAAKNDKLAGKDMDVLKSLLDREVDLDGKPVKQNDKDALYKYSALTNNPRVAKVVSDAAKARSKKTGEPLDPLYNLTDQQQNIYYRIQATPYKSDDYNQLTDANPWLDKFRTDRAKFFQDNPLTGTNTDKVPYPVFSSQTQSNLDNYFNLDDSKAKAQFMSNHPDVQSALDEMTQYGNQRREATGYARFKDYPKADTKTQQIIDFYNNLPTGDGKKGGNATRYAWIQSHPDDYKKLQDYYAKTSAWQLANNAGKAKYEGEDLNQQALKAAYSLGQYDIAKTKDANGNAIYSIDPQAAYAQSNTSSGGSKKNYFANTEQFRVSQPNGRVKKSRVSVKRSKSKVSRQKMRSVKPRKNVKAKLKSTL